MTIKHYGTPITPVGALVGAMGGASFCVPYAYPAQLNVCLSIGESVMGDCSEYTHHLNGEELDRPAYYAWCEQIIHYPENWVVAPDKIGGGVELNDALLREWPHRKDRSAAVYHLHEPIERFLKLAEAGYKLICFGSSEEYWQVLSGPWCRKMDQVWRSSDAVFGHTPPTHMLRGFQTLGKRWPFGRVDSTDVARNHNRNHGPEPTLWVEADAPNRALAVKAMRERWDPVNCPPRFIDPGEQLEIAA